MNRYIAFLRGINVGGHRVKMEDLRDLFTAMDFVNVETFIASGNVIFETADSDAGKMEKKIEAGLKAALGYEVSTFLRTPAELAAITAANPFPVEEGHTVHIGFHHATISDTVREKMLSSRTTMDDFHVKDRELYWLCRGKTTESLVSWPKVMKSVTVPSTMRNMTMLSKLVSKYSLSE